MKGELCAALAQLARLRTTRQGIVKLILSTWKRFRNQVTLFCLHDIASPSERGSVTGGSGLGTAYPDASL
jgi:hypothetical protein